MHIKLFNTKNGGYQRKETLHALPCANGLIRYNQPRQNEAFPPSLMFSLSSRAKRGVFISGARDTGTRSFSKLLCLYELLPNRT